MGKKIVMLVVAALIVWFADCNISIEAATFKSPYIVEQAQGKAPEITAYVTGNRIKGNVTLAGTIAGNIPLSQGEKSKTFQKSGRGIHYIILIDNSGSVEKKQLFETKRQIISMRKGMGEKDKMTLYTVGTTSGSGEKKNVLGRTAAGNKKKNIRQDVKKIQKIPYKAGKKSKTVLYRSLNQVLAASRSPEMRTVVLMVTDGEDDSTGKDNSKGSTVKQVKDAAIPIYGILLKNKSKNPNKEKIRCTTNQILAEENCRGYYADCRNGSPVKSVKKAFSVIQRILKKETYVIQLWAPNNRKKDGIVKLSLTAHTGGSTKTLNSIGMDYSDSQPDTEAPVIQEIRKDSDNSVSFRLVDNSGGVIGADQTANYVVKTKTESDDGKVWPVSDVKYDGVNNTVVLILKDKLYTGDYILNCNNIYDDTQEENRITQSYEFSFEGLDEQEERKKQLIRSYWWIALIVIVVLIGIIVIYMIKKKPGRVVEVNTEDLLKADSKLIRLTITDRAGAIKDVEWNVEGSLFVGRSDICNIYFDDERLSKQHFVIEVTKMACYIEDLESTNGTFVNGVKIVNRRMLLDDDVITAGREKFVFHTVQQEKVLKEDF